MLFAHIIDEVLVPNVAAIVERVSPCSTMYWTTPGVPCLTAAEGAYNCGNAAIVLSSGEEKNSVNTASSCKAEPASGNTSVGNASTVSGSAVSSSEEGTSMNISSTSGPPAAASPI